MTLNGWSTFYIPSNSTVFLLIILCLIVILVWTCFLWLSRVWVLLLSNLWSPFSSGAGFTVASRRSCRGNLSLKNWHVQEVVLTWGHFKMRTRILFSFYPFFDLDCTQFGRSFWGLKFGAKYDLRLHNYNDARWCFVVPFLLLVWHTLQ